MLWLPSHCLTIIRFFHLPFLQQQQQQLLIYLFPRKWQLFLLRLAAIYFSLLKELLYHREREQQSNPCIASLWGNNAKSHEEWNKWGRDIVRAFPNAAIFYFPRLKNGESNKGERRIEKKEKLKREGEILTTSQQQFHTHLWSGVTNLECYGAHAC